MYNRNLETHGTNFKSQKSNENTMEIKPPSPVPFLGDNYY